MQGLENHFKYVHEKKKAFKCTNCDAFFLRKCDLNLHFRIVHEQNKPFNCSTCGVKFTKNCNLKIHTKIVHERKKPFICNNCRGKLNYHISEVHEGQRTHKCDICGLELRNSILITSKYTDI